MPLYTHVMYINLSEYELLSSVRINQKLSEDIPEKSLWISKDKKKLFWHHVSLRKWIPQNDTSHTKYKMHWTASTRRLQIQLMMLQAGTCHFKAVPLLLLDNPSGINCNNDGLQVILICQLVIPHCAKHMMWSLKNKNKKKAIAHVQDRYFFIRQSLD